MKYLPLSRQECLYLLLLLQSHKEDLGLHEDPLGDDAHVKEMNASLLDKMNTVIPNVKLCAIHGDGPIDMEKDAECIVCEGKVAEPHTCNPRRLESEYDLSCAGCRAQKLAFSPFVRDPRVDELSAADMEVLYATGTPRPEKKE